METASSISKALAARIFTVLEGVPDPEIPIISVTELGIVRGIFEDEKNRISVHITPTYTGCPATQVIEQSLRTALDAAGFGNVELKTVLSPAWSSDMISDEGREKLRIYGIAPPPKGATSALPLRNSLAIECPRCRSRNTREISRFGSTPCKALWQCNDCQEPFDRFKCH
jgi:ring-1,2-phenylacetyl-CoA epoxidase subunit PaaD